MAILFEISTLTLPATSDILQPYSSNPRDGCLDSAASGAVMASWTLDAKFGTIMVSTLMARFRGLKREKREAPALKVF